MTEDGIGSAESENVKKDRLKAPRDKKADQNKEFKKRRTKEESESKNTNEAFACLLLPYFIVYLRVNRNIIASTKARKPLWPNETRLLAQYIQMFVAKPVHNNEHDDCAKERRVWFRSCAGAKHKANTSRTVTVADRTQHRLPQFH